MSATDDAAAWLARFLRDHPDAAVEPDGTDGVLLTLGPDATVAQTVAAVRACPAGMEWGPPRSAPGGRIVLLLVPRA